MKIQEIVEAANPAQQAAIAIAKKKKQVVAEGNLEEIDRRGFLKGVGAAAVAGAAGGVTAQTNNSPTEFANYAARLATSSIKDGLPMIARMTGGDNVRGGWFNHVYPNIHQMILSYCTSTNSYNARQVIDSANKTALQASGITEVTPGRNFANQINVFMSTYRGEILQAVRQYENQSTQTQHEKNVMGNLNKDQFDTLLDALLIYAICKDKGFENSVLFKDISASIRRFIDANNAKEYVNNIYPKAKQSVEMLKNNPDIYQKEASQFFRNAGNTIAKLDNISSNKKPEFESVEQGVAEGLNEFATGDGGGGDSGRWYTDDELADIIGDDWFEDFDVSHDEFNIDAYGEKAKQNLASYANSWFDDKGYNVNVMGVDHNEVDHDLQWYIVGSFHNPGFADKDIDESNDDKIGGRYDADEFDAIVARLGQRAKQGPMKTVWDPERRVYKNVPVNQEVDEASLATMRDYFAGDKLAADPTKTTQMRNFFNKDNLPGSKVQKKEFQSRWEYEQWLKLKQHLKK
jgi:hypothetical protein